MTKIESSMISTINTDTLFSIERKSEIYIAQATGHIHFELFVYRGCCLRMPPILPLHTRTLKIKALLPLEFNCNILSVVKVHRSDTTTSGTGRARVGLTKFHAIMLLPSEEEWESTTSVYPC
jgi:hypothetical protein